MNNIVNEIVGCMAIYGEDKTIQTIQTEHRLKLAKFWGIKEGDRVLEIGCGQGDTTAVLAYLVGESGFVHGVDLASPSYGSPITLGDAIAHLKESKLGKQIHIQFDTDLLNSTIHYPENSFDIIVFSHCSWYFQSHEQLTKLFEKVRRWGSKLCFAEWDTRISQIEQLSHYKAVFIQAQLECFKENSLANVRTLFTPVDIKEILEAVGWNIVKEDSIYSPELQDGEWEVDYTLTDYEVDWKKNLMPDKLKRLIKSEITLLQESMKQHQIKPMSTYVVVAK